MFFHQGAQLAELFTQVSDRLRMFGLGDKGLGLVAFLIIGAFFTARAGLDLALMAFSFLDFRGLGAVF